VPCPNSDADASVRGMRPSPPTTIHSPINTIACSTRIMLLDDSAGGVQAIPLPWHFDARQACQLQAGNDSFHLFCCVQVVPRSDRRDVHVRGSHLQQHRNSDVSMCTSTVQQHEISGSTGHRY
jgi:hypothetical protein